MERKDCTACAKGMECVTRKRDIGRPTRNMHPHRPVHHRGWCGIDTDATLRTSAGTSHVPPTFRPRCPLNSGSTDRRPTCRTLSITTGHSTARPRPTTSIRSSPMAVRNSCSTWATWSATIGTRHQPSGPDTTCAGTETRVAAPLARERSAHARSANAGEGQRRPGRPHRAQPRAMLVGQMTGPVCIEPTGTLDMVGVRLRPCGAAAIAAAHAKETRDCTLPLDAIDAMTLGSLTERLSNWSARDTRQLTNTLAHTDAHQPARTHAGLPPRVAVLEDALRDAVQRVPANGRTPSSATSGHWLTRCRLRCRRRFWQAPSVARLARSNATLIDSSDSPPSNSHASAGFSARSLSPMRVPLCAGPPLPRTRDTPTSRTWCATSTSSRGPLPARCDPHY